MCQAGTQFDSDSNLKETGATQTSICAEYSPCEDQNICPLCRVVYKSSVSFDLFHEHVLNHFREEPSDSFEMVP